MSNRLGGKQGTAYGGTNADQPPNWWFEKRDPNMYDTKNYSLGDLWLNKITKIPWVLVSLKGNDTSKGELATWVPFTGPHGDLTTLSDDNDVLVFPDLDQNIDIKSGNIVDFIVIPMRNLITTSDPETNTLYIGTRNSMTLGDLEPIEAGDPALTMLTGNLFFAGDDAAAQEIVWARPRGVMSIDGGINRIFWVTSTTNNTLIGSRISTNAISNDNSGFGSGCLMSIGLNSNRNSAIGKDAGLSLISSNNSMVGYRALAQLTNGAENCVIGSTAAENLISGSRNTVIGSQAGSTLNGAQSDNILIQSIGTNTDSSTLRIGNATGTGNFELNRAFIQGIRGITTAVNDADPVLIDSAGQLGTVSSSRRYKENINDIEIDSSKIYNLRPVSFNYITHPKNPKSLGLIAEEVSEIIPELVRYKENLPESVKYQDLPILLLNEIKKLNDKINMLENRLIDVEKNVIK